MTRFFTALLMAFGLIPAAVAQSASAGPPAPEVISSMSWSEQIEVCLHNRTSVMKVWKINENMAAARKAGRQMWVWERAARANKGHPHPLSSEGERIKKQAQTYYSGTSRVEDIRSLNSWCEKKAEHMSSKVTPAEWSKVDETIEQILQ